MGVCVDPARKVDGVWHHDSDPVSPGFTYSHWKKILNDLRLFEAHVEVGTMPTAMLRVHLDRFWPHVEQRVHAQLVDLLAFCDENGYDHIGWA